MILAAGVGSRLMPLTTSIPKPMVPVANRPTMEHGINLLKRYGITDVIANLHYLPSVIKEYFVDGSSFGVSLKYSKEQELLGTAGGVKKNQWFLDDTFIILSGDALTDIRLDKMINFHKEKGALATIALKEVEDIERFGVVITDRNDKIISFQEKPKKEEALSNLVNTGIYIFEPEIFNLIPQGQVYDFGKQLFPLLVEKGLPFYAFKMEGYWCDIGNFEAYQQSHYDILDGKVDILVPISYWRNNVLCGKDVSIHPSVKFHGKVLIGEGTTIGRDVEIFGNVTIGSNCKIGDRVIIQKAIIWDDISIASNVILKECVIGKGAFVEEGAVIDNKSVISDCCKVEAYAKVSGKMLEAGRVYTTQLSVG